MFNFGFKRKRSGLPRQDRLFISALPNSEDTVWDDGATWEENMLWGGWVLPLSCFAVVGIGPWFSNSTTPITRIMGDIIADPTVNIDGGFVFASLTRGVAFYSEAQAGVPFLKLSRYFGF